MKPQKRENMKPYEGKHETLREWENMKPREGKHETHKDGPPHTK